MSPLLFQLCKMSNSVVKVTDEALNDSLLLLVGEDGTVTPDKETVTTYLSKTSPQSPCSLGITRLYCRFEDGADKFPSNAHK